MWAAAEGHAAVVEALLEAGADFRARLPSGFTPLLFAVREGRLDVVRVLLKAGADVNEAIPPDGRPRVATAARAAGRHDAAAAGRENGHFELAARAARGRRRPERDLAGFTALHTITWVRKPGDGDNDPAPDGSGKPDQPRARARSSSRTAPTSTRG